MKDITYKQISHLYWILSSNGNCRTLHLRFCKECLIPNYNKITIRKCRRMHKNPANQLQQAILTFCNVITVHQIFENVIDPIDILEYKLERL